MDDYTYLIPNSLHVLQLYCSVWFQDQIYHEAQICHQCCKLFAVGDIKKFEVNGICKTRYTKSSSHFVSGL